MKTLIIKDLARTEELGRTEMAAVRGGYSMSSTGYSMPPGSTYSPSSDSSVHATQDLKQFQSVFNATANGSAFLDNLHVTNTTDQFGQNNILVG
jgi:hypothetical protein